MTAQEFKAWTDETAGSQFHWQVDPINQGLYYIGGESGRFILVEEDGTVSAGTYEDAIPHIGEAVFHTTFTKKFDNKNVATARVIECGGKKFLLDILGFRVYR